MATTPIEVYYDPGKTLTVDIFPRGSDTASVTGRSLTEETNRDGVYKCNVTEALSGYYTVHVLEGTRKRAIYDIYLTDTTSTHYCYAVGSARLDSLTVSSNTQLATVDSVVDAIKAKTDQLAFGTANRVNAQVYGLQDDVITAAVFDESTAFPLKSADTGSSQVARVGADGDTLETLSDLIDIVITGKPSQKYSGVRGPGVYYSDDVSNTTTVFGIDGTIDNPVSSWTAATTLCGSLGANRVYMVGDSTLTLTGETVTGFEIIGLNGPDSTIVNLGTAASPSVLTRVEIFDATVYGTHDLSDRVQFWNCELTDAPAAEVTILYCYADGCLLTGDITVNTTSENVFRNCSDGIAGSGYPIVTAAGASGTLLFTNYQGDIGYASLSASHAVKIGGMGEINYESSCNVNAEIRIHGHFDEVDNTAGMNNVVREANYTQSNTVDVGKVSGSTTAATNLKYLNDAALAVTVDDATFTPTTTAFETTNTSITADDTLIGMAGTWYNSAGTPANTGTYFIEDSEGTTTNVNNKLKITTETMPAAPADGDIFVILGSRLR